MPSSAAPRCRHIKVSGIQCGSPALRDKNFCFYHQQDRRITVDCYYKPDEYSTGEINLPPFEDAHSIQTVIRQVVQMVLQKRLERKTASLMLYALQIASSNLKRMEQEKPQPEQVVTDLEMVSETPIAAINKVVEAENKVEDGDLPPGTIQACYQPYPYLETGLCPVQRSGKRLRWNNSSTISSSTGRLDGSGRFVFWYQSRYRNRFGANHFCGSRGATFS